jgi:hypothetical protein
MEKMKAAITLSQDEIILLIARHLQEKTPGLSIGRVCILTNSKQNYRARWEECSVIALNDEAVERANEHIRDRDKKWPSLNRVDFVADALESFIGQAKLSDLHVQRLRQIIEECKRPEIKVEVDAL